MFQCGVVVDESLNGCGRMVCVNYPAIAVDDVSKGVIGEHGRCSWTTPIPVHR